VALSVALGTLAALAGVGLMSVAGYLISRAAEHPPILSLTVAIVAVRAFGIGKPVARYFERLESHDLALRVLTRMRTAFYRTLEPLVPARVEGYRQGDLLARMVGDVDAMQNLFLRGISPPLVALIVGAFSVTLTGVLLPAAAAVLAVGLLLGGIAVPLVAARAGRRSGGRQAMVRAELTAELVDLLRGGPELVMLGSDEAVLARVRALDAELERMARRDALMSGMVEGLGTLVAGLTVAGVLAVCVEASAAGTLDRVLVAALALGAVAAMEVVAPLPGAALGLQGTTESGRRLLEIAHRRPVVADLVHTAPLPTGHTMALEGVSFDHGGDEAWGLRDVDLRLAPGRRIALVGPSGSGKSTVAALLVRYFDPDSGCVTMGDVDVRSVRQHDLRSMVSVDGQEGYLFSSTIRENVRLAKPRAEDAEIEDALRRARIWDWVAALPEGLDTFMGEEGRLVSGGEGRRIALARTFLGGAPVIVLDEPTAHLDPETADDLMSDALAAADGRSVLVITHRTEGLGAVDQVMTLRRGRLEER
jgi:thiol reductant ABC exporter CydC subunit